MSMYEEQKKDFQENFNKLFKSLTTEELEKKIKLLGYKSEDYKEDILANTDDFDKFVTQLASIVGKRGVTNVSYAAVAAAMCEKYKVKYKVKVGYCLDKADKNYTVDKDIYKESKEKIINHIFLILNNKQVIEYFVNGDTGKRVKVNNYHLEYEDLN